MYKDFRYINAGENEFYRWGKKAQEKVKAHLIPNNKGYYAIPVDGGKYWSFGTNEGKFGEFAKYKDTYFSVNSYGFLYAKEGTEKAEKFIQMLNEMIETMKSNFSHEEDDE